MSTIAIGDVHGNLRALNHLLLKLTGEITPEDTVVFLGDIIDGFPDSRGCVERILQFRGETSAATVAIMGNHEEWLLRTMENPAKHSWVLSMKGLSTIRSYSRSAEEAIREEMKRKGPAVIIDHLPLPYEEFFREVPPAHREFFRSMAAFHRDGDTVFVHGGVSRGYTAVEKEDEHSLRWGHAGFPEDYEGPDTIVYGHWSDKASMSDGMVSPHRENPRQP